jgi:isoquinoline 1-oxidoreductase beta subunit
LEPRQGGTGDSTSIRAFLKPLRLAGAATRPCIIEAAAHSWGVSTAECRTENSKVIHDQSGRALDYGALVNRATAVTPPKAPPLKEAQRVPIDRPIAKAPRHSRQGQW